MEIIVEIDLIEGVLEVISFIVGDKEFWKKLDYQNVPFNCSYYKYNRHLKFIFFRKNLGQTNANMHLTNAP